MKKIMKKCLILNFVLAMTIASSIPTFAYEEGPGFTEEYNLTDDGYIIVDEIPIEDIETMVSVNSESAPGTEQMMNHQYYTINDGGHTARLSNDLQDWVYQMCAEYGLSGHEKLVMAKLYCESSYNPNAKNYNRNGTVDYGLAQINSSNHARLRRTLGITDFMDPYQSIRAGVFMLSESMQRNGYNEQMSLVAYNTGKNGISSSKYSRRIMTIKDSALLG